MSLTLQTESDIRLETGLLGLWEGAFVMSNDSTRSDAIYHLGILADDCDPDVRIAAAKALARYSYDQDAIYHLGRLAEDCDPRVRRAAAMALGGRSN
jgi:HEAT repeat protein